LEEGKSLGKKYKPFSIGKITKKLIFGEEHSPTHYQGALAHPEPLWGVSEHPVHPCRGALPSFEKILGLLRQIGEESLKS
jgi:hypothetical protein